MDQLTGAHTCDSVFAPQDLVFLLSENIAEQHDTRHCSASENQFKAITMDGNSPCTIALDYLEHSEVKPISECLPSGSASFYVPARKIRAMFEDRLHGLTAEILFLCPCARCIKDGGAVQYRSDCFNRLRQQELTGEYAHIYALLIYVRRPGLIQKFQKYEIKLEGTKYLSDVDFDNLRDEGISDLDLVQRKTLQNQYSFLVRTIRPASDIVSISAKELLPIKEDAELKGEGTFAEVRCFEFQDDEYRSREFGEVQFPEEWTYMISNVYSISQGLLAKSSSMACKILQQKNGTIFRGFRKKKTIHTSWWLWEHIGMAATSSSYRKRRNNHFTITSKVQVTDSSPKSSGRRCRALLKD